jgi:hypothetical protein
VIGGSGVNKIVTYSMRFTGGEQSAASLGAVASSATWAAAAVASVGIAAWKFTDQATRMAGAVYDVSRRFGVMPSTLAAFSIAAEQAGTDMSSVAVGLSRIARSDEFGADMSPEERLLAVADEMQGIANESERVSRAIELFGRSGASLIPMLQGGSEELRGFIDQAREAGMVLSDESYRAADEYGDSLVTLRARAETLKTELAIALIPTMNAANTVMVDTLEGWNAIIGAEGRATQAAAALEQQQQGLFVAYADTFDQLGTLTAEYRVLDGMYQTHIPMTAEQTQRYEELATQIVEINNLLNANIGAVVSDSTALTAQYNALMDVAMGYKSVADVLNQTPGIFLRPSVFTGLSSSQRVPDVEAAVSPASTGGGSFAAEQQAAEDAAKSKSFDLRMTQERELEQFRLDAVGRVSAKESEVYAEQKQRELDAIQESIDAQDAAMQSQMDTAREVGQILRSGLIEGGLEFEDIMMRLATMWLKKMALSKAGGPFGALLGAFL